jgi:hypothetical protein
MELDEDKRYWSVFLTTLKFLEGGDASLLSRATTRRGE